MEPPTEFLDCVDGDHFDWGTIDLGNIDLDINIPIEQSIDISFGSAINFTHHNPGESTQLLPVNSAWAFPGPSPTFTGTFDASSHPMSSPVSYLNEFNAFHQPHVSSTDGSWESCTSPSTNSQFSPATDGLSNFMDPCGQPWQTQASNIAQFASSEIGMGEFPLLNNSNPPFFPISPQTNTNNMQHDVVLSATRPVAPREPCQPQYRTLRPANTQQALHRPFQGHVEVKKKKKKKQKRKRKAECEYCGKRLYDTRDKTRHYNVHREEAERDGRELGNFVCPRCDKTYTTDWGRTKHMKKHSY